jgi:hypothetical protein
MTASTISSTCAQTKRTRDPTRERRHTHTQDPTRARTTDTSHRKRTHAGSPTHTQQIRHTAMPACAFAKAQATTDTVPCAFAQQIRHTPRPGGERRGLTVRRSAASRIIRDATPRQPTRSTRVDHFGYANRRVECAWSCRLRRATTTQRDGGECEPEAFAAL